MLIFSYCGYRGVLLLDGGAFSRSSGMAMLVYDTGCHQVKAPCLSCTKKVFLYTISGMPPLMLLGVHTIFSRACCGSYTASIVAFFVFISSFGPMRSNIYP